MCGGSVEERLVDHEFDIRGELVHFRSVPAKICTRCGEKRFAAAVAKRIEHILDHRDSISLRDVTFIHVPSFDYGSLEKAALC